MAGEAHELPMWVVYFNPWDFPGKWVVRRRVITYDGREVPDQVAAAVTDSLLQARAAIPGGLVRIPRDPADKPAIVESWL